MSPDHPSAPPGPEPYPGRGMCFELQVEDAAAAPEAFTAGGLEVEDLLSARLGAYRHRWTPA